MTRIALISLAFLIIMSTPVRAQIVDDWKFSPSPANGIISGTPGSQIGWGYSAENQSSRYWLFLANSFTDKAIERAIFTDLLNLAVLAPNSSNSVFYTGTDGLASFTWDADAPEGFSNSGMLGVQAYWYTADPFDSTNPGQLVGDAGIKQFSYTATVSSSTVVPEASGFMLLCASLCMLVCLSVLRHRHSAAEESDEGVFSCREKD